MIPTHVQVQPWWPHNNAGSQHKVQLHSKKSIPTVQFSHPLRNSKQLQDCLPQYFTHILITYLHWCFGPQGDILSENPALQVTPAIRLRVHSDVAISTGR